MCKVFLRKKILWFLCFFGTAAYGELIDPTAPTNYTAEASSSERTVEIVNYTLQAILISESNKIAVINDNVVKIGDTVGEEAVTAIDSHKVTLVGARGELELKLFENSVKEPVE